MTGKDFDKWNETKKLVHKDGTDKFYHTREIWWCALGINVGFEQDGSGEEYRRPVLILKGFRVLELKEIFFLFIFRKNPEIHLTPPQRQKLIKFSSTFYK